MSKFTFICEDEPMPFADAIITKKTFEFNADHLFGVIGEFETFLRGCGYTIDGNLVIEPVYAQSACTSEQDDLDNLESIFSPNKSVIK